MIDGVYLGAKPWGVTEYRGLTSSVLVTKAVTFKEGPITLVAAFETKLLSKATFSGGLFSGRGFARSE